MESFPPACLQLTRSDDVAGPWGVITGWGPRGGALRGLGRPRLRPWVPPWCSYISLAAAKLGQSLLDASRIAVDNLVQAEDSRTAGGRWRKRKPWGSFLGRPAGESRASAPGLTKVLFCPTSQACFPASPLVPCSLPIKPFPSFVYRSALRKPERENKHEDCQLFHLLTALSKVEELWHLLMPDISIHPQLPGTHPHLTPPHPSNYNTVSNLPLPTFGSLERASSSYPLVLGRSVPQGLNHHHYCHHHCQSCPQGLGAGFDDPCLAADLRSSACSNPWLAGSALRETWLKCLGQTHLHCPQEFPQL